LQQIQKRKEEEHAERVKQEELKARKAAERVAKEKKRHEVKDETCEDFPKARKERERLAYWLTKAKKGDGVTLLPADMDHEDIVESVHRFYTADADFKRVEVLHTRVQDYVLLGGGLFGQKLSSNAKEIADFLDEKSSGSTRGLAEREKAVKRLVECAMRRGWLGELAALLVKDAKKIKLVDQAEAKSSTLAEIRAAFDEHMKKSNGQPLWSLSASTEKNLAMFRGNMTRAMKEKYPRSKYAVRVLEAADVRGWLRSLAEYAAEKMSLEDEGDFD
jgi:hypothetical protein